METVVRVETIEQWKSVLDVWFSQGHHWAIYNDYQEKLFNRGSRQLVLDHIGKITFSGSNLYSEDDYIEYADFMAQKEKTMAKETYYVTQEQLDLINELKSDNTPIIKLYIDAKSQIKKTIFTIPIEIDIQRPILRYIGGDTSVEFKVKEQLYRLWRIDDDGDRVYMKFNSRRTPFYTMSKVSAFTAPLEEIKIWKTPAWEIEKAD